MSTAKEAFKRETSKFTIAITGCAVFAIAVCAFVAVNQESIGLPSWILAVALPPLGYAVSILLSSVTQYSSCGSVNIGLISLQNLWILASNALVASVLFLETLPLKRYMFGDFPPTNPVTGLQLDPNTPEYATAMESESHYKLQFFSGVVKAALPLWMQESVKEGLAYCYWIFFMNLLPLYTLFGVQTACS